MRLSLILLLVTSGLSHADDAQAVRDNYAERDKVLRAKIEAAEDELAKITVQVARLKLGIGEPQNLELDTIVVDVRADGIFVGGKVRTSDQLQDMLRAASASRPDFQVRLTSAADTDWAQILPALNACYHAKIWRFDFQLSEAKQ